MTIKPIENDHPGDWHMERFVEFSAAKAAIGEPTPHMRVVDWMARDYSDINRMWLAGCYLTAYSVLTGEAIAREWPWRRGATEKELALWLKDNWGGIHTRKPRRCVRTPGKFAESLYSYGQWMQMEVPKLRKTHWASPQEEYDGWWESASSIRYYGRYIAIRLLEIFRRWGYMNAHLYDIRAVGAHSPIRCLMLLEPESVSALLTGEAAAVNEVAQRVKSQLKEEQSYFTFATLLCEYRAGYEDGGDYAGNQHDEELEYSLSKYAHHWQQRGYDSQLYRARAAIDPHECLGEIQGWSKRRTDVARWLRERGTVWSDLKYDYLLSREAGEPVVRK